MYMAPIVKAESRPAAANPALRRLVGVPVLIVAGVVALPWAAMQALVAGVVLTGRVTMEAVDYAGTIALGR